MAIASAIGIGSGIDINTLVTQLVTSEGQPAFNAIQRQESAVNARLSGLGTLKSALSDFQSVVSKLKDGSLFQTHQAASSDESRLLVTAGIGSVAGSHTVEITQLATRQKSIATAEFANLSDTVGTGSLTFTAASGSTFNLLITDGNKSLSAIRDAINGEAGNDFVTASIINVDNADSSGTISKLVLTAKEPGSDSAFTVTGTDSDGQDDALGLSRIFSSQSKILTGALDAIVKVDEQTATRSTNSLTDVLPGLTLDLKAAGVGTKINVEVTLDTEAVNKTIGDFVSAYNKLHTTTKNLGKYGGSTDGSGSGNGALLGDSTLRLVASQMRQLASNTVSSAANDYNSLAMIGIKIDKEGVMSLDSTQLNSALAANLQSVSSVFSSSDGVATRLDARLNDFLQSGGPLDSQQSSLQKQLSGFESRRNDVQARMDSLQKSLLKQFTAMDLAVGQFRNTGSFLSNWINTL